MVYVQLYEVQIQLSFVFADIQKYQKYTFFGTYYKRWIRYENILPTEFHFLSCIAISSALQEIVCFLKPMNLRQIIFEIEFYLKIHIICKVLKLYKSIKIAISFIHS